MSGGVGLAQFRTCTCGGLLNETWDACRFCGEATGLPGDDGTDELADPGAPTAPAANNDAAVAGGPAPKRSTPVLPVLAVAVVIGLLGFFVFEQSSDSSESDRDAAEAERAAVVADFENWCAGDRAIGIIEAPTFDLSQTDRAVFVAPVPADDAVHAMSRVDDPQGYASVIVCQDMVGEPVDGEPCAGSDAGGTEPPRIAFFNLVAYSSRSAEVLGAMDAGPNLDCSSSARSPSQDEPAPVVATPDPATTRNFITLFSSPT